MNLGKRNYMKKAGWRQGGPLNMGVRDGAQCKSIFSRKNALQVAPLR